MIPDSQSNGGISVRSEPDGSPQSDSGTETNELALASLFLGIFWVFGFGSIAAIYLGRKALREIDQHANRESGRAFAWVGILSGIFGLASSGLVIAVALTA